jgi:hypothetical protein
MQYRLVLSQVFTFACVAFLGGCSIGTIPTDLSPAEGTTDVVGPSLSGSVYGGHAPLVGAKLYMVTPNQAANYGAVSSLMNSSCTTQPCGSAVSLDTSGGVTNGFYYVTTDSTGSFNLTGEYSCTANKAVYIVGVGGSPTFPSSSNVFSTNSVTVSNLQGTGVNETATYTFTTTTTQNFYIGEQVTLSNLNGTGNTGGQDLVYLDGYTANVLATNLTTTTFAITAPDNTGGIPVGTYPLTTGTVTALPTVNPAAVNMAVLGMCPANGTFAGSISYIYMNEISTVAAAYAMAGYGTDAFHIGVNAQGPENGDRPAYVLNALKQAMLNAGLLYDIQGSSTSTTYAGEGHIARSVTPEGNGTVPQASLDTIGNILAACVDSNNAYGTTATGGTESTQCKFLFQTATSDGIPVSSNGSTTATDIAGAAFNMAHHPAGGNSSVSASYMNTLFTLPAGNVPFAPNLITQPNDFAVQLAFTVPASQGSAGSLIDGPQIITVDGGNYVGVPDGLTLSEAIYVGSYYKKPVKLFSNGTPDYTTNTALAALGANVRAMTPDLNNNVWVTGATANNILNVSSTGATLLAYSGTGTDAASYPFGAAVDPSGDVFVGNYGSGYILKLSTSGVNTPNSGGGSTTPFSSASCLGGASNTSYTAADPSGTIYAIVGNGNLCVINKSTGRADYQISGYSSYNGAGYFAVIPSGSTYAIWGAGASTNTLLKYVYGDLLASTLLSGGGLNRPCSLAVDGGGNVWAGNGGNSSVSEFAFNSIAGTYTAVSPASTAGTIAANTGGFAPLNSASNCANPAIDRAGDVWVSYQGGGDPAPSAVYEIIGAAIPTVTPIAYATRNNVLATRPY